MLIEALYHCDVGSNSTKRLEPSGTASLVKSSINGIRGIIITNNNSSNNTGLQLFAFLSCDMRSAPRSRYPKRTKWQRKDGPATPSNRAGPTRTAYPLRRHWRNLNKVERWGRMLFAPDRFALRSLSYGCSDLRQNVRRNSCQMVRNLGVLYSLHHELLFAARVRFESTTGHRTFQCKSHKNHLSHN